MRVILAHIRLRCVAHNWTLIFISSRVDSKITLVSLNKRGKQHSRLKFCPTLILAWILYMIFIRFRTHLSVSISIWPSNAELALSYVLYFYRNKPVWTSILTCLYKTIITKRWNVETFVIILQNSRDLSCCKLFIFRLTYSRYKLD